MTPLATEVTIFWFVAQCLNHLCYCMP